MIKLAIRIFRNLSYTLVVLLILSGCSANSIITPKEVTGAWRLTQGFEIVKIKIDSLDEKKRYPVKYNELDKFICVISLNKFNEREHEEIEKRLLDMNNYWAYFDTKDADKNRKGLKSVRFFERDERVRWIKVPINENEMLQILTLDFQPNFWYRISKMYANFDYRIYFYIDDKGKMHDYHFYGG